MGGPRPLLRRRRGSHAPHPGRESARRRNTLKRGGDRGQGSSTSANLANPDRPDELLAVDEALAALAAADHRPPTWSSSAILSACLSRTPRRR